MNVTQITPDKVETQSWMFPQTINVKNTTDENVYQIKYDKSSRHYLDICFKTTAFFFQTQSMLTKLWVSKHSHLVDILILANSRHHISKLAGPAPALYIKDSMKWTMSHYTLWLLWSEQIISLCNYNWMTLANI